MVIIMPTFKCLPYKYSSQICEDKRLYECYQYLN